LARGDASMILKHKYFYFKKAVSDKFCDDVIKYGLRHKVKKATVRKVTNKKQINTKKYRNSDVVFLDEAWLYREIQPFVHQANKEAEWNFQWDWTEPAQFTIYGPKQFYNWHIDTSLPYDTPNNLNTHNKLRKISMTINLSDPKDYKGGHFEFDFRDHQDVKKCKPHRVKEIGGKGSLIVFPSDTWHRVTPITRGTRYSLVVWNLGYSFK
jgi:PKHD-type hydroxylase